jgi:hypothetical protein
MMKSQSPNPRRRHILPGRNSLEQQNWPVVMMMGRIRPLPARNPLPILGSLYLPLFVRAA